MKLNSRNELGDRVGRFTYQLLEEWFAQIYFMPSFFFLFLFTHLKIEAGMNKVVSLYDLNTDYSQR